jgi:HK97 family phage major capsid protein
MNTKILGWMHERQAKVQMARAILDSAEAESRGLTEDEEKRYTDLLAAADGLQAKIDREQDLEQREATLDQPTRAPLKPSGKPGEATIGMDKTDIRRYSLVRAINALATGNWRDAKLELEASQAVAQRLGFDPQGLFVPYDWVESRDLVKGTPSAGGYTVATELLAQDFINLLRSRVVVMAAGATVLSGLAGDVAIPRQTGGATAYWVAENGAPTESQPAFDQVAMSPKTVGAYTDISRKLLKQSSLDVEGFVRRDLATILGIEIDRAGLHGSGANNQPTGLASVNGIGLVFAGGAATNLVNANGAAPVWADLVALETEVAVDNADLSALRYITNARVRGKLKTTPKQTNTDSIMLWESNDTPLNGYPALVTNQVSSALAKGAATDLSAMFFGNWADLFVAMWGTLDLLVDPYTGGTAGTVRVIALQDTDIAVRHPQSFAAVLDLATS